MVRTLWWAWTHWSYMSQLVLGALAFLLAFRPGWVTDKEQKHPSWKWWFFLAVVVIAGTGIWQGMSSDDQLHDQIATLYRTSKIEATKTDVQQMIAHMDEGFDKLATAMLAFHKQTPPPSNPTSPKTQAVQPLPAPPHISVSQSRAMASGNSTYGLQVTIQSDESVPVSFAIKCSGPISSIDNAFLVGQGAYISVMRGIESNDPTTALIRFGYPPLTPQSPLVVYLSASTDIRVERVTQYAQ